MSNQRGHRINHRDADQAKVGAEGEDECGLHWGVLSAAGRNMRVANFWSGRAQIYAQRRWYNGYAALDIPRPSELNPPTADVATALQTPDKWTRFSVTVAQD